MDGYVKEAEPAVRRTLKASPAMLARLGKPLAQHVVDKPPDKPPLVQPKPAAPKLASASNEAAKINTPPDPAAARRARRERRNALFLKLSREIAPALFATRPPPPMAIGIHAAIVERHELGAEAAGDLGWIISQHVNRVAYQRALAVGGAVRLDLDGKPAGLVTEEQRALAVKKLTRLKAQLDAPRAPE